MEVVFPFNGRKNRELIAWLKNIFGERFVSRKCSHTTIYEDTCSAWFYYKDLEFEGIIGDQAIWRCKFCKEVVTEKIANTTRKPL